MEYKSLQRKTIFLNILRFLVPFLAFVGCFALGLLWDDNASFFITLALAVLAVASFIYFSNKVKRNLLILEDLIFTNALKGIYDKKKTTNARSFLNISELVRNKLLIEPYKRYGFLYYEVVYNRVVIDSSNLTLEYLEDSNKKRKKTYYGFLGRAIRYELRSHHQLYLVNKKSKYFNVGDSICDDDTFLVSGFKPNYERLVKNGSLANLKEYLTKNNLNASIFYLNEAIYILLEEDVVTINPKLTKKIDDEYINNYRAKFRAPRDLADILKISK